MPSRRSSITFAHRVLEEQRIVVVHLPTVATVGVDVLGRARHVGLVAAIHEEAVDVRCPRVHRGKSPSLPCNHATASGLVRSIARGAVRRQSSSRALASSPRAADRPRRDPHLGLPARRPSSLASIAAAFGSRSGSKRELAVALRPDGPRPVEVEDAHRECRSRRRPAGPRRPCVHRHAVPCRR